MSATTRQIPTDLDAKFFLALQDEVVRDLDFISRTLTHNVDPELINVTIQRLHLVYNNPFGLRARPVTTDKALAQCRRLHQTVCDLAPWVGFLEQQARVN